MTTKLWDHRFMQVANLISTWSKDPRRKVGCVIIDDDRNQLAGGYNGFPRGVADDHRLAAGETINAELKLLMIIHAEANAVANAARNGHCTQGGTVYITCPPCSQCAGLLIQAGVKRIVYAGRDTSKSKWRESYQVAKAMLSEARVELECLREGE